MTPYDSQVVFFSCGFIGAPTHTHWLADNACGFLFEELIIKQVVTENELLQRTG
jgi:hypothetical protein